MKIEGNAALQTMYSTPAKEPLPVIDEKAIKSILYLCIKGDVKIRPEEGHTVDTLA